MDDHKKIEFLGQVYINFRRSETAYQKYMQHGKQFVYAKILKNCNEKILSLLLENAYLLPDDLINESVKLISHIDIWLEKWRDSERRLNPNIEDEFVFENKFTFPREAAQKLEKEFLAARKQMN